MDDLSTTLLITVLAITGLPIAAGILLFRYRRSSPVERAKTAWALAGFGGAIAMTILIWLLYFVFSAAGMRDSGSYNVVDAVLGAFISLFPLLAIYPIFRYQLFDLGFVVNRAALYSALRAGIARFTNLTP